MELMTDILENELKNAFEVKNEQSLHRYVSYLSENIVTRQKCSEDNNSLKSDIKAVIIEMREGFNRMDKRFEDILQIMDKRFEGVDKRFEQIQHSMDTRFEQIQHSMDTRFEEMNHNMDKRFEEMNHNMDKRFEDMNHNMDKRFEDMNRRFDMQYRFVTIGFAILATMMTVYQFIG